MLIKSRSIQIPKDVVEKKKVEEPKAKIDIWKKRHTDRLFEEARERFWQRREERQQGLVAWPWTRAMVRFFFWKYEPRPQKTNELGMQYRCSLNFYN